MTEPRILITGIVGMRPAVIYATLTPLLSEIRRQGLPEILLAATSGKNGSHIFCHRLKDLAPLSELCWLEPTIFSLENWDSTHTDLLRSFFGYNKIYILLKGGMGIWLEQILYALQRHVPAATEVYFITSDGRNTILTDRLLQPLRQLPLASLGLDRFLSLNGLNADGKKVSDTLRNGLLQKPGLHDSSLPFLMLCESGGNLYAAIFTEAWLEEEHYQLAFRQYLQRCSILGLERGRILLVIPKDKGKAYTLRKRAEELSIRTLTVNVDNIPEKLLSQTKVIRLLTDMANTADPRDTTQPPADLPKNQSSLQKECNWRTQTLVMAVSGTDSFVNLLCIATHRPRQVILCYDRTSNDTIVAATRLQQVLMHDDKLYCQEVIPLPTDQMGWNLNKLLTAIRQTGPYSLDINLTPGTKDQSFALLIAAAPADRIWVSDARLQEMTLFTDKPYGISWQFPALHHIGGHLGGPLLDNGMTVNREMITQEARRAVLRVFSHLAEINSISPLSALFNGENKHGCNLPLYDDNGVFHLTHTGERFILAELFPWFDFTNQKGEHDPNLWLEPFTALCLVEAGADEVVCNMKWQWNSSFNKKYFRDELDIVARFDETIIVVSCKTNPGEGEKRALNLWEVHYMAERFFGRFAKPFLACPMYFGPDQALQPISTQHQGGNPACKAVLLGVNHLVQINNLRNFLSRKP